MIYVECDNDTRLMKYLQYGYFEDYRHPGGKGNVLRNLKLSDISLGIIDSDTNDNNGYPQLSNFDEIATEHNLRLLQHNSVATRKIIEIPDNIETWFYHLGQLQKVDFDNFKVLDSFGSFKKDFSANQEHHLFEYLAAVESNSGFRKIVDWISTYR